MLQCWILPNACFEEKRDKCQSIIHQVHVYNVVSYSASLHYSVLVVPVNDTVSSSPNNGGLASGIVKASARLLILSDAEDCAGSCSCSCSYSQYSGISSSSSSWR